MMLPYLYGCLPMMLCKSGKWNLYVKIVFCCITIGCNTNIAYISTHIWYITIHVIQKKVFYLGMQWSSTCRCTDSIKHCILFEVFLVCMFVFVLREANLCFNNTTDLCFTSSSHHPTSFIQCKTGVLHQIY